MATLELRPLDVKGIPAAHVRWIIPSQIVGSAAGLKRVTWMKNTITAYLQLKNKSNVGNPKIVFRCILLHVRVTYTWENKQIDKPDSHSS